MSFVKASPPSSTALTHPPVPPHLFSLSYDVVLTTSSDPSHSGSAFWISVYSQYASTSPSTYAVLQYKPQDGELPRVDGNGWPLTPPPQPGMAPWTMEQTMQVRGRSGW